ncbi:class I SAM-dependent methyltransferase [Bradyrhizobium sp. 14AA]
MTTVQDIREQGMASMDRFVGTKQEGDALQGRGVLQSTDEWEARNGQLAGSFSDLINEHVRFRTGNALDIGCQNGELTDRYASATALHWQGIEPDIGRPTRSAAGLEMLPGVAHALPFGDQSFDCVTLANVFEHLEPALHNASMAEIYRVLAPGGILVGQIPNPYFPIESHSRLPFFGFVPYRLQPLYWKLTPTGWDFEKAHFFIVTIRHVKKAAAATGLSVVLTKNFNYRPEAIPKALRLAARLHSHLGIVPWAWQFVFRRLPAGRTAKQEKGSRTLANQQITP